MRNLTLPKPSCPHGYTVDDIARIMGDRRDEFSHWMRGQTCSSCEGKLYDHGRHEYYSTECGDMLPGMPMHNHETNGGHGIVTYSSDVRRFLLGLPVID